MATTTKKPVQSAADLLAAAEALVTNREAGLNAAQLAREELLERVDGGDDTVTAMDLVLADAEVERAERLIPSARQAVKRAERAAELEEAQNSPTLAQWLHQLIEKDPFAFGLQGMPISVGLPPADAKAPATFLSQQSPTNVETSTGMMTGTVFLDIVLPKSARWDFAPVQNTVQRLIVDSGLAQYAQVTSRQQLGSPKVMIEIGNLKPEIPALPGEAPEKAFEDFGFQFSDALRSAGRRIERETGDSRWNFVSSTITSALKASELVDVSEASGVIRRRVSVTVEGTTHHVGSDFGHRITLAVDRLVGEIAPWLGRVESGSVVKVQTKDPKRGDEVGRARTEQFTVQAEFVMVSTLA